MMEKSSVVAQINKDRDYRLSVRNQAEIEKSATGPNSPETNVLEDFHEEPAAQRGLRNTNVKAPTKGTRQNWSREEYQYREVMESFSGICKFTPIKRSKLINDIIIKEKQEKTCMLIDIYGNPLRPKYISKSSREIVQI